MDTLVKVPELRFPEFSGDWDDKKLGDIIDFKAGYAFKSTNMSHTKKKYQLIKMSNVYRNVLRLDRNASYWESIEPKHKDFLLEIGDTVLTLTGTVGKRDYGYSVIIIENDKFLLNQRLVRLREVPKYTINKFINYILLGERFLFYFFLNSKGGTGNQSNVSVDDIKFIHILFPQVQEQQKIAQLLTTVDTKIDQLTKKKTLLEQYKKGVSQKLFSQEIRFKADDGKAYPDWVEKKLGEETNCLDNKRKPLNGSQRNQMKGEIPYYGANGIVDYVNDFIFNDDLVLLAEDGGNFNEFSSKPIAQIISGKTWVNNHAHILQAKNTVTTNFLFYSLVHKDIRRYIVGGSRVKLNKSDLLSIKINLPSLPEQQKIANFLSSIDTKIDQASKQLSQTKQFKKALLQQMFV